MENTPETVLMRNPMTGEHEAVPFEAAPPLHSKAEVQHVASPASAPATHKNLGVKSSRGTAFNVSGDEVVMERAYYRGQHGINTYSNTVRLGGDIYFIEELSGQDFQVYKAAVKHLEMDARRQQQCREVRQERAAAVQSQFLAAQVSPQGDEPEFAHLRDELVTLAAAEESELDELLQTAERKIQIHREIVEKTVRGCSNPVLATAEGRNRLYAASIEELAVLIIQASLLGQRESDFLGG